MASITYKNASCIYEGSDKLAVDNLNLDISDGEFVVLVGPSGFGQEHRAADARRTRGHRRGRHRDRRQGHDGRAVQGPRHRDGLPELCAVPQQDGRREHGLRTEVAWCVGRRAAQEGRGRRQDPRPDRASWIASPPSCPAVSGSASRWAARSCASRRCSAWTSRCRTSTPSCVCRPAPRSPRCNGVSAPLPFTSPTIRSRR